MHIPSIVRDDKWKFHQDLIEVSFWLAQECYRSPEWKDKVPKFYHAMVEELVEQPQCSCSEHPVAHKLKIYDSRSHWDDPDTRHAPDGVAQWTSIVFACHICYNSSVTATKIGSKTFFGCKVLEYTNVYSRNYKSTRGGILALYKEFTVMFANSKSRFDIPAWETVISLVLQERFSVCVFRRLGVDVAKGADSWGQAEKDEAIWPKGDEWEMKRVIKMYGEDWEETVTKKLGRKPETKLVKLLSGDACVRTTGEASTSKLGKPISAPVVVPKPSGDACVRTTGVNVELTVKGKGKARAEVPETSGDIHVRTTEIKAPSAVLEKTNPVKAQKDLTRNGDVNVRTTISREKYPTGALLWYIVQSAPRRVKYEFGSGLMEVGSTFKVQGVRKGHSDIKHRLIIAKGLPVAEIASEDIKLLDENTERAPKGFEPKTLSIVNNRYRGYCYVFSFPYRYRFRAKKRLGKNPTVAAVKRVLTELKIDLDKRPQRLFFVNSKHAKVNKSAPGMLKWQFDNGKQEAILAGDDEPEDVCPDTGDLFDLVDLLLESDMLTKEHEAGREIKQVPRLVGGAGRCWMLLPVESCPPPLMDESGPTPEQEEAIVDYDEEKSYRKTVDQLLSMIDMNDLEDYQIAYVVEADSCDFHVSDVLCTKKRKGRRAGRITSEHRPMKVFVQHLQACRYKEERVAGTERWYEVDTLVGSSHIDQAINLLRMPENMQMAEGFMFPVIGSAVKEMQTICPWAIPKQNQELATKLAIPWSARSPFDHDHPIHAAIRRLSYREARKYWLGDTTVMFMRQENFNYLNSDMGRTDIVLKNAITDMKDFSRYGGEDLESPFTFPECETRYAHWDEAGHYMTPANVAAYFEDHPDLKLLTTTHIYPLAALNSDRSANSDQCIWVKTNQDLVYYPEGDKKSAYIQPLHPKLLLTSMIRMGNMVLYGQVVWSMLNTHLQIWTKYKVEVPDVLPLAVEAMMPMPKVFRSMPTCGMVPVSWWTTVLPYVRTARSPLTREDVWGKLRQLAHKEEYVVDQATCDIFVSVVLEVSRHPCISKLQTKHYHGFIESLQYKTFGHSLRLFNRAFRTKYKNRWNDIIKEPNPVQLIPLAQVNICSTDGARVGRYRENWKLSGVENDDVLQFAQRWWRKWFPQAKAEITVAEDGTVLENGSPFVSFTTTTLKKGIPRAVVMASQAADFIMSKQPKSKAYPNEAEQMHVSLDEAADMENEQINAVRSYYHKKKAKDAKAKWEDEMYEDELDPVPPYPYEEIETVGESSGYETPLTEVEGILHDRCFQADCFEHSQPVDNRICNGGKSFFTADVTVTKCHLCLIEDRRSEVLSTVSNELASLLADEPPGGAPTTMLQTIPILLDAYPEPTVVTSSVVRDSVQKKASIKDIKQRQEALSPMMVPLTSAPINSYDPTALAIAAQHTGSTDNGKDLSADQRVWNQFRTSLFKPVKKTGFGNVFGSDLWDLLYPATAGRRHNKVPFRDVKSLSDMKYPKENCLLMAFEKLTGLNHIAAWGVALSTFPSSEIGTYDQGLSTRVLEVLCLHKLCEVEIYHDDGPNEVVGVINGPRYPIQLRKGHWKALRPKNAMIMNPEPSSELRKNPLAQRLLRELSRLPMVNFKPWTPERERAIMYVRAMIDGTTGLLGVSTSGKAALKAFESYLEVCEPPKDVLLCCVQGDPGCRKSSSAQAIMRKPHYHDKNTFKVVLPTTNLQEDWRNKLEVKRPKGPSKKATPGYYVSTFETVFTNTQSADLMVVDELGKFSKGYMALLAYKYPNCKAFITLGDPQQTIKHEVNSGCKLNDPEILSEDEYYQMYSTIYLRGTWRHSGTLPNIFRTPSYCTPGRFQNSKLFFTQHWLTRADQLRDLFGRDNMSAEDAEDMWKNSATIVPSTGDVLATEELNINDVYTYNGSQGLAPVLSQVIVTPTALKACDLRSVYTALTRSTHLIIVVNRYLSEDARNAKSNPIWDVMLNHYMLQGYNKPVKFDPDFTIDMSIALNVLPKDIQIKFAGPPEKATNRKEVEKWYSPAQWDDYIDPDDRYDKGGHAMLSREDPAYVNEPNFLKFIDDVPEEPIKDVLPQEVDLHEEKLKTHLCPANEKDLIEYHVSQLREREDRELTWNHVFSNQFPDQYLTRLDAGEVRKKLVKGIMEKTNLRRFAANRKLERQMDQGAAYEHPLKYDPKLINLGQLQRVDDEVSFKLGIKQRIETASYQDNVDEHTRHSEMGRAMFDRFVEWNNLPTKIPFDEDRYNRARQTFSERRAARSQAMKKSSLNRADPDYEDTLFAKGQWKMKDEVPPDAKPLQMIFVKSDEYLFKMGGLGVYLLEMLLEVLPPNVYLHAKKTFADMQNWVATYDPGETYQDIDIKGYDGTQKGASLEYELLLMQMFSVPDELIEFYKQDKLDAHTKSIHIGLMRLSGEIYTWLFNTMHMFARTLLKYDLPKGAPIMVSGDDVQMFAENLVRVEWIERWEKDDICEEKMFVRDVGTFCSWVIKKGFVFKDPTILFVRLCGQVSRGNVRNVIHGYALEFSTIYALGDRIYDLLTPMQQEYTASMNRSFHNTRTMFGFNFRVDFTKVDIIMPTYYSQVKNFVEATAGLISKYGEVETYTVNNPYYQHDE